MDDRVFKRQYEDTYGRYSWSQLVTPCSLREEVLQELHSRTLKGHLGEEKTLYRIKK